MKTETRLDLKCDKIGHFIIRTLEEQGFKANRQFLNKGFRGFVAWEETPEKLTGYTRKDYILEFRQYVNEFMRAMDVLIEANPESRAILLYYKVRIEDTRNSEELWKAFEDVREVLEE